MFRRAILCGLFIIVAMNCGQAIAQFTYGGVVSTRAAHRYGLSRAWHTQVNLDRNVGEISDISQHISNTKLEPVWQLQYNGQKMDIKEDALNKFGKPQGAIGAMEVAAQKILKLLDAIENKMPEGLDPDALKQVRDRADQLLLKVDKYWQDQKLSADPLPVNVNDMAGSLLGFADATADGLPKLLRLIVPQVTLYVATDQGVIHAIDGENGRTRWSKVIGRPNYPSFVASNDDRTAVVNGSTLYILNSEDGTMMWEKKMNKVPGERPAVNADTVYVPLIDGGIEGYPLIKPEKYRYYQPSIHFQASGRGLIRPIVTESSLAWPTTKGYFYVANTSSNRERYRLDTDKSIVVPAAALAPFKFIVASIDGYVYCVHENSGQLLWRFSTGQPLVRTPVGIGKAVYVITEDDEMFKLDADTGHEVWWTRGIRGFVAASETRVYCKDDLDRMILLDAETGSRIAILSTEALDLKFTNLQTDRIFVGTKRGMLQCLHETKLDKPLVHAHVESPPTTADPMSKPASKPAAGDPAAADPSNPFGGGATTPATKTPDPFGGGSDPFGGGSKPPATTPPASSPDPFGGGGGSNPFGDSGGDDNPFK